VEPRLGRIADDEVAVAVDVETVGQDELARALALAADRGQIAAVRSELLDASVPGVEDVDVAGRVDGYVAGEVEGDALVLGVDVADLADEIPGEPRGVAP
jgi:hypothetical protein